MLCELLIIIIIDCRSTKYPIIMFSKKWSWNSQEKECVAKDCISFLFFFSMKSRFGRRLITCVIEYSVFPLSQNVLLHDELGIINVFFISLEQKKIERDC